jgi:hypothetical protein
MPALLFGTEVYLSVLLAVQYFKQLLKVFALFAHLCYSLDPESYLGLQSLIINFLNIRLR